MFESLGNIRRLQILDFPNFVYEGLAIRMDLDLISIL